MKFKYEVEINSCTKGFALSTQPLKLPVRDLDKENSASTLGDSYRRQEILSESPKQEGMIHRQFANLHKNCLSHGGHYILDFPSGSTPDQKILLIAATLMLDYSFFDRKCCLPFLCFIWLY